ncbi:F-box/LRR-repeat protein At3g59200-like [Arachis hypogaea]|uniref:F-box/LRR-repeat protein At3g59200-like n=1 Tax=Arachis hypogaea TaxID=3818 RepID=UPI000DEDB791|nr:F-box/LRR-repeat protein At3g59200-like [Arachis hypogaea]
MDRISLLPNSILCDILSYLPTKEAVSTSILSRRWRHVWKELQVLDIDDTTSRPGPGWEARFVSYVNAILARRNADFPIQKFRLSCYEYSESSLTILTWLDAVIGPYLQELYLCLDLVCEIDLPEAMLTSPSLKSLALKHGDYIDCYRRFPNVYLPSLKNLELDTLCVDPSKLLSGCPVLENLMLIVLNDPCGSYVYIPTIQMPRTLKSLIFEDNSTVDNGISHRVIDTPSLEYLYMKIIAKSKLQVSFSDFPNMVEAHLHIHHGRVEHVLWVPELLLALRETKLLALKHCATECLFNGVTSEFPEFPRLLNLELDVPCFNTDFLLNFLHNCHVLEGLVVHVLKSVVHCEYFHRIEFFVPAPPTMVSNCVTSHLKSFEFREYENSADEREFIEYLLQRGLVLKRVTIHLNSYLDQETKYDIVKELSAIPRGSTTCQLNFIDQNPVEHAATAAVKTQHHGPTALHSPAASSVGTPLVSRS